MFKDEEFQRIDMAKEGGDAESMYSVAPSSAQWNNDGSG